MAKGKVTINEVICKGCGLCVSVCPKSVLALSTTKINPAGYNPLPGGNDRPRKMYCLRFLRDDVS